jgi:hypothetical protein
MGEGRHFCCNAAKEALMETRLLVAYFLIGILLAGAAFVASLAAKRRQERRRRWANWHGSRRRHEAENTVR